MTRAITILLLCLLSYLIKGQTPTANAGADQTIYLSAGTNSVTLSGSATNRSTSTWTEVSTDYSSGGTITSPSSLSTTVTGLNKQGVFYFELAVKSPTDQVAVDTVVIKVDYEPAPPTGVLVENLPINTSGFISYVNNRTDTTSYFGYGYPDNYPDSYGHTIYLERCRLPGMTVQHYSKLYTTIEDGYKWGANNYARSECTYGVGFPVDTNKIYTIIWKGYYPQDSFYLDQSGVSWAAAVTMLQIHGNDANPPPLGINIGYHGNIFVGDTPHGGSMDSLTIGQYADYYNQAHTIKLQYKESQKNGFVKIFVDGVQKYYRTGVVGSTWGSDYFKGATNYDYGNRIVDVNNTTRNRSFSLVTLEYSIYIVTDTTSRQTVPITWATPSAIIYGTALSGTQLNATAPVAGTFSYSPASGAILNAGINTLTTTFTPSDLSAYAISHASVSLTINKDLATMSYSGTTTTYNGSAQSVTVNTSPSGLSGVSTTYNNLSTLPVNAGSYSLVSSMNNTNYYANNITGTLTINKATATISVSNTSQTYTGSPLSVTATVSPAVSGLSVTYNGSSTAPTNAGTYTVIAKLTNSNYQATPDTVTFTINKATPTVSWATPSAITYGVALSGTQLNAAGSVAGAFAYTPASGTVLNAGTQILSVDFAPTDATNYNSVNNTTVSLVVNKASATLTLSNLNQYYDGNPKPVTVTTSPVGLGVVTVTYNGSTTVPSAVGSYPVVASLNNSNYTATNATGTLVISSNAATIYITNYSNLVYNGSAQTPTVTCAYSYAVTYNGSSTPPTNVGSYTTIATINDGIHTGADTVTMTIIKATPVINWSTPSTITYGTALSGTQLNASSTTAGTFVYTPVSGTVLNVGTYVLSTAFTPTDASNYNSATATVNLTVNQATATITASNFSQVYDATPKPITASVSPSVSGLIVTYDGSATPPTNAGSYALNVSLNNQNYTATTVTGTLVISKITPILSWTKPTQITEGTPLSSSQLNATSDVAGSFTYTYPTGTVLSAGTYSMTATFTPSDTTNYNSGTVSTSITVFGNPFNSFFISSGKIIWKPQ